MKTLRFRHYKVSMKVPENRQEVFDLVAQQMLSHPDDKDAALPVRALFPEAILDAHYGRLKEHFLDRFIWEDGLGFFFEHPHRAHPQELPEDVRRYSVFLEGCSDMVAKAQEVHMRYKSNQWAFHLQKIAEEHGLDDFEALP